MDNTTVGPAGTQRADSETEREKEKELREAVERVYRRYGTDLSAFGRDVQRDVEKDLVKRA